MVMCIDIKSRQRIKENENECNYAHLPIVVREKVGQAGSQETFV